MDAQVAGSRRQKKEKRKSLIWLTEAQAALGWGVILALASVLGAIYLYQASHTASVGRHVQGLQVSLDNVKRVNADLERDIAEAQSLERVQSEAARLGFARTQPESIEYLVVPDYPVAQDTRMVVPTEPLPVPYETIAEALWATTQSAISSLIRGESP
jgi:cell division protein FtsL